MQHKQYRIGHTGITWGFEAEQIEAAVRDTAALGYQGFETFGDTIEAYNQQHPAGFGALLEQYNLPLASVYCPAWAVQPEQARESVDQVVAWASTARDLGASAVVVQAGKRGPQPFTNYGFLVEMLNEIGQRLADLGLAAAVHPHAGTLIENRHEIDAVFSAVDPRWVGFAPDTGHITKGGSDPVAVMRDYAALIRHVHLKDYAEAGQPDPGDPGGFVPLGMGAVDYPAVFALLDEIGYDAWVMVELNPPDHLSISPREGAQISLRYLKETLKRFM
jgi:inosose dehydratase